MPKLTSVASTQKKFEPPQGRVAGEQNFGKFAKFSEKVETGRFCARCSFQRVFVRERARVFRTQQCRLHISTHILSHTHTIGARTPQYRNRKNPPQKIAKLPKPCQNLSIIWSSSFVRELRNVERDARAHTHRTHMVARAHHSRDGHHVPVFRIINVVRIPTVFAREQGRCLRASIWSAVSTSHPRGNPG